MKYLGKRIDRMRLPKQVGTDPELGAILRNRADRMGRSIEIQILHLIEVGLEHDPEYVSNARQRGELHETAPNSTFAFAEEQAKQIGAPPRTSRHVPTQKRQVSA